MNAARKDAELYLRRTQQLEKVNAALLAALEEIARCPYPNADPGDGVSHKPLEVCHDEMKRIARAAIASAKGDADAEA